MEEIISNLVKILSFPGVAKSLGMIAFFGILLGGLAYWDDKKEFMRSASIWIIFLIIVEWGRYNHILNQETIEPIIFMSLNVIIFLLSILLGIYIMKNTIKGNRNNVQPDVLRGADVVNQYLEDNNQLLPSDDKIMSEVILLLTEL